MHRAICFGEILWDKLPTGRKPGGAPMNVALHLHKQGFESHLTSSVGNDLDGRDLKVYLSQQKLSPQLIQQHPLLPTGTVDVHLDERKQASYTIKEPVAWDEILLTDANIQAVERADVFVFGSLAARNSVSRETLLTLLSKSRFSILDLNLRPPHYNFEHLIRLMASCNILKINEHELEYLRKMYNLESANAAELLVKISKRTGTPLICVTQGDKGAIIWSDGQLHEHSGYKIKVADTVGAGDAFLGSFISGFLNNLPIDDILSRSCAAGALVASKPGANPDYTENDITEIVNSNLTSG